MSKHPRKRVLAFEQLEAKANPATLLLALAPLDDAFHVAAEQVLEASPAGDQVDAVADISGRGTARCWTSTVPARELLRFIEAHTTVKDHDSQYHDLPSCEQCRHVDEMMKLDDVGARALIIAEHFADESSDSGGCSLPSHVHRSPPL